MADALLSMVMKKLGEEVKLVGGAKVELQKLSSTFKSIQALLNHAETRQFTDEHVRDWLEKLKDVAYDVDDVLDDLIPSAEESESGTDDGDNQRVGNQVWACLSSLFSCFGLDDLIRLAHESWTDDGTDDGGIRDKVRTFLKKVSSQRDLAHQIKEINARLDQIAAEKNNYSFKENYSLGRVSELDKADFRTSSLVDESQMLGRDEEKDIIISKLISGSSDEEGRIHVISIVGVGGLGKTTLAGLIFKDERVRSHFDKVLWVCASDDFDVIRVTKAIIEDAEGVNTPLTELNPLQNKLLQTLQGKRFLLVLDDVWNDDSKRWEKLWLSLQSGAQGSKILVTTRSNKVATTCMPSSYKHELKSLSNDDCWSLFSSRAFAGRKIEDCQGLVKIGEEIVKKCKGVPLSAKVIGSAMRSKTTAQDWEDIFESEIWKIPDIAEGILPLLLVSYYNLPVHLKQCFAYCSIFPKDHVLDKDQLVKLWLAQGFVKLQGKRKMEAIGGEYFDDLLARSLFQYGKHRGVVMHDLLHDVAQFVTKNECCIFEKGKWDLSSVTARHSSFITTRETSQIPAPLCQAKKLRTLIRIGDSVINNITDDLFHCAKSLRALDFGGTGISFFPNSRIKECFFPNSRIKELPSSIGLLKHLRYLDLSYSGIVELPESVSSLRNLQTLKLNCCRKLQRLPSGMSAMVRLRHLEIEDTWALKYLPVGLGRIRSLQTLNRFVVGGNGECKIGELKRLNSLQGKLQIDYLERVGSGDEAKEAELDKKLHLRVLFLSLDKDFQMSGDGGVERMNDVLEALRPPHTHLEELVIERRIGSKFPTWMEELPFSNLVELRLLDCYKCTQLPGLGRLPSLKSLVIGGGLMRWVGHEFYGNRCGGGINRAAFPKLEKLEFNFMPEFEEWELRLEEREIMPSLQTLKVFLCPKLKALPHHLPKTLQTLKVSHCPKLKALPHHLPKTLKSLCIIECSKISEMPCLPLLEDFQLWSSVQILSMPLPNLFPSLKTFEIKCLETVTLLPNGWEQFKSLQRLIIGHCSKLRSLPDELGQLKSLTWLDIEYCPELLSLPQGLRGLTHLFIDESPVLADRCRGEDWRQYIPYIYIDGREIKRGTEDEKIHQVDKVETSQPGTTIKDDHA